MRLLRARGLAELGKVALALLHRAFGWKAEKWDLRKWAKTADSSLGEKQLGKLGEEKDEEKEPATEQSWEYTDLGLDLGEREEQVACHASALALQMTNEARREAEM